MKQVGSKKDFISNKYYWSDGSSVNTMFFSNGQPDNYLGLENCLNIFFNIVGLNDFNCMTPQTFMCQ